jgi:nitrogenase molybdenum-iron protein alpha/beta subunit
MTRTDFQRLARMRLRDARVLLRAGNNEGAYYLTGLAVECGLKSAIARKTRRHDFPPEPKIVSQTIYVHDLNKLLVAAGLERDLNAAVVTNPGLKANWALVKDWTIESRYLLAGLGADGLYRAVTGRNGVFKWLRQYW